ncbi:MAG: hypothetical protein NZM09_04280 [Ignavibacterium sp.]|nr:hypothetical protein [Ignavibacterium sp.]MCX7611865.1 hypothetical protein [Ignavibacterium sp.]MDW8374895.1 hypothetical protein [Ignavibacteriales bacterium]
MNKSQKILFSISALIIISILSFWLIQGGELFTKTKILVDNTSELDKALGIKNEVWVDKFILGLDYSAVIILGVLIITFLINYYLKTKRKEL